MGLCNSSRNRLEFKMSIYIPSWDRTNNIGGIRRTAPILRVPLYIGQKGNRGNGDRPPEGRITSRERKDIERVCQGVGSHTVVTNPLDIFTIVPKNTTFVLMESPEFWKERDIIPVSLYDITPNGNMMFVFGNERDGISNETLNMFPQYVPCYLPQDNTLINTRKRHNNVSLNLAHAVVITIGVMKGKGC